MGFRIYSTEKVHISKLEVIVQDKIAELKITMNKATHREVTDFLFTKIETLRWVLYVIHSINKRCPPERSIIIEDSLPTRNFMINDFRSIFPFSKCLQDFYINSLLTPNSRSKTRAYLSDSIQEV